MKKSETFHTDNSGLMKAMEFVKRFLTDCNIKKKARTNAVMVVEEVLGSLVMGIDTLVGMFRCTSNCLGDVAVTSIVARSEGQMDIETYQQ